MKTSNGHNGRFVIFHSSQEVSSQMAHESKSKIGHTDTEDKENTYLV